MATDSLWFERFLRRSLRNGVYVDEFNPCNPEVKGIFVGRDASKRELQIADEAISGIGMPASEFAGRERQTLWKTYWGLLYLQPNVFSDSSSDSYCRLQQDLYGKINRRAELRTGVWILDLECRWVAIDRWHPLLEARAYVEDIPGSDFRELKTDFGMRSWVGCHEPEYGFKLLQPSCVFVALALEKGRFAEDIEPTIEIANVDGTVEYHSAKSSLVNFGFTAGFDLPLLPHAMGTESNIGLTGASKRDSTYRSIFKGQFPFMGFFRNRRSAQWLIGDTATERGLMFNLVTSFKVYKPINENIEGRIAMVPLSLIEFPSAKHSLWPSFNKKNSKLPFLRELDLTFSC